MKIVYPKLGIIEQYPDEEEKKGKEVGMRTITIKSYGLGRYDDVSPFPVTDNKLELQVELPDLSGEFYFVYENNGAKGKRLIPTGSGFILENLTAGTLNAEVKHYLKGVLIKTYKVESLVLAEVDGSIAGTPEIEALEAQDKLLAESLDERKKEAELFAEELTRAKQASHRRDVAFLAFAYAEYQSDVQLNSKSLDIGEFLQALGYSKDEFTEEELEEIKRKKEVL